MNYGCYFYCATCSVVIHADAQHAGRLIRCGRCGHVNRSPTATSRPAPRSNSLKPSQAIALAAIAFASVAFVAMRTTKTPGSRPAHIEVTSTAYVTSISSVSSTNTVPSADSSSHRRREHEIIEGAATKSGDPQLAREYNQINERYFRNELPSIPVIWESRLAEVGPLIANEVTLQGLTDGRLILLNSTIRGNHDETTATLCHEMVHVYLAAIGQRDAKHGPAFQTVLRRLSEQGAFQALWASDAEKRALRSWVDGESVRLDAEFSELAGLRKDLDRRQSLHGVETTDLNARIIVANQIGHGWPSEDEIASVKAERSLISQLLADFNDRVDRVNADSRHFNAEARRYDLMMAYPDGLDEESVVPRKRVLPTTSASTWPS